VANHKSAEKRHRQSLKRRGRNRAVKTRIKNVVKSVREAVQGKDKEAAVAALKDATKVLDRAATKKVVHWRHASRSISRLSKAVNALG
jgi:small subunit ribosomal protein S20